MVYSMRSCGSGYTSIETFTTLMNLPKPMTKKNDDNAVVLKSNQNVRTITEAVTSVAKDNAMIWKCLPKTDFANST